MRYTGCIDGPDLLKLESTLAEPLKQAGAAAQDHGCDREVDVVDQAGRQELVDQRGAAGKPDVPPRSPCISLNALSGKNHWCSSIPPIPSGFCSLWSGPAT